MRARTAANGDLPEPFASRLAPWLKSHSPVRWSNAYHQSKKRSWSIVGSKCSPARGPFGWMSFRHQVQASQPSV